jgi:hypothetical protein
MNLVHCIYCSASSKGTFSPSELQELLDQCRLNNAKLEITGILLYKDGSFFQILEGDETVVKNLFETIAKDKRHKKTTKIIVEPIEERSFANWTMGYPKLTTKELAQIPGLNDFYSHGKSYLELGEGRAKALLAAFKEGRWRASIY